MNKDVTMRLRHSV